jgi:Aldehyde dehydrogenase family
MATFAQLSRRPDGRRQNQGSTVCQRHVFTLHRKVRLAETAGAMKVADGFEPGAVIGPLIDMTAVEKVEAHIADAVKEGAKVVFGGKRAAQGGSFFEPTVLTDVTTDMVITREETFGPVAPLYRFKTEAEAIEMANGAPTLPSPARGGGLGRGPPPISTAATSAASGVWPRASNTASSASTKASSRRNPAGEIAPFGGMKESGIGPSGVSLGLEIRHRGIPRLAISDQTLTAAVARAAKPAARLCLGLDPALMFGDPHLGVRFGFEHADRSRMTIRDADLDTE